MKDFINKIAVITGAASGIGLAFAKKAFTLGMRLVLVDNDETSLKKLEKELTSQNCQLISILCDVTDQQNIQNIAEQTIAHFGIPQLLFNNAGVGGPIGPIWEIPLEKMQKTFDINLMSIIYSLRAFMPYFLQNNTPTHIINTASMAGFYSAPCLSAYEISKHAAVVLSEALHHDLKNRAPHVHVSVLCPGWVNTNIVNNSLNEFNSEEEKTNADDIAWLLRFARSVKKGCSPDEVAEKVFQAILDKKFYIFTDTKMKEQIVGDRMQAILAEVEPVPFDF